MARRSDHSREELQQMAISAAIVILNEQGFSGLSARKVAKSIGYTVGTLYLVFKNLDELLLHVNAATLDDLHQEITAAACVKIRPAQILKAMALAYMHYAQQHSARWSLLFSHQLPEGQSIPSWFDDKIVLLFDSVKQPLQSIQPQLNERALLQATRELWSGVHGACALGLNDKLNLGGAFELDVLIESFVENYLYGFAKE